MANGYEFFSEKKPEDPDSDNDYIPPHFNEPSTSGQAATKIAAEASTNTAPEDNEQNDNEVDIELHDDGDAMWEDMPN